MDSLSSTGAIVTSSSKEEPIVENRSSTIKKVAIVALCILVGVGFGAITAATGGLDIVVCLAVGAAVGLITGLFLLLIGRCCSKSRKTLPKREETSETNAQLTESTRLPKLLKPDFVPSKQPTGHPVTLDKPLQNNVTPVTPMQNSQTAQPLIPRELVKEPAQKASSEMVEELVQKQFIEEQEQQLELISQTLSNHAEKQKGVIKLSDAELDLILEVVDQTKVGHYRLSQYQVVYKEFVEVFGEQKAREAFRVPGLIDKKLPPHISPKLKDHLIVKAKNYFHNQEVLQQLRGIEKKEFQNEFVLDEVLHQINIGEYLTGQRQFSKATENHILECVRGKHAQKSFEQLLEKVKGQAQKDLYLDEEFIEKKFNIATILTPLTDKEQQTRREQLQKVINQAFVSRELKQKGKLTTGKTDEMRLLRYLGYTVEGDSKYQDKEFIYGMIQEIIQNQLQNELATGPLALVKQTIKICSQNARLKAAGLITALQLDKFRGVEEQYATLKHELTQLQKPIVLPLPTDFPLSPKTLIVQSLRKNFESLKLLLTNQTLSRFFRNPKIKEKFEEQNVSVDDFSGYIAEKEKLYLKRDELTERCKKILEDPMGEALAESIKLHHKWGKFVKAELIQGFIDPSEALGDGVCWGNSQRVRFVGQKHPDMTAEELAKEIKLTGQDRYFQGAYQIARKRGSNLPGVIAKEGYESKQLCRVVYDMDEPILAKMFHSYGAKLKESAGWMDIGLAMVDGQTYAGHALLVRWDTERNRYWVVDSNIGFLCFDCPNTTNEAAQERCLDFLKDLIKAYYPLTIQILANQLIKTDQ